MSDGNLQTASIPSIEGQILPLARVAKVSFAASDNHAVIEKCLRFGDLGSSPSVACTLLSEVATALVVKSHSHN